MFGSTRVNAAPDLMTVAKGLTSAHAPMGAVIVSDKVAAPLYYEARALRHGITFGGHPLCAAIALKNLEIFERDGDPPERGDLEGLSRASGCARCCDLPIVGDVRGAGFFWARSSSRTTTTRAGMRRSASGCCAATCRGGCSRRGSSRVPTTAAMRCAGGAAADLDRAQLDEMVDGLGDALGRRRRAHGPGRFGARERDKPADRNEQRRRA